MRFAIKVEDLGKSYLVGHNTRKTEDYTALRDVIAHNFKTMTRKTIDLFTGRPIVQGDELEEFWALRGINLEIKQGERVGIIGRNGAGKSTLLKILSRITGPTTGRVELGGRVASLLEVGTGFHPELTGRENIFLNGAILGMSKAEMRRKFDAIVEFAEVEKFLDTPVKRYSSGMYVRLAFSVAAHLEPDILIVDEVLAVGDASFQRKCMGRMESISNEGRTLLFVSHNMGAISELCSRAVLLDRGGMVKDGSVAEIIGEYARMGASAIQYVNDDSGPSRRECFVEAVRVVSDANHESGVFDLNETITIEIDYSVQEPLYGLQLAMTISRNMVEILHTFDTDTLGPVELVRPGTYRARHRLTPMFLKAGAYSVSLTLGTPTKLIQDLSSIIQFEIEEYSVNPVDKGYRKDRIGHVISPGIWERNLIRSADDQLS